MAERAWPGEQLVAAAQRGEVEAISALVSGSHPNVRRFARSLCATPEDAEDAAQEALIILYRRIGMLRASGALASWMFRIVRNECLRRARLAVRDRERGRAPAPDLAADSAEDEALRRLEADRVAAAVAALPPDQRRVLVMRDVQGHSGRAVAAALGLSTPAMKSRLHRARAAVRHSLHDPHPPVPELEPAGQPPQEPARAAARNPACRPDAPHPPAQQPAQQPPQEPAREAARQTAQQPSKAPAPAVARQPAQQPPKAPARGGDRVRVEG